MHEAWAIVLAHESFWEHLDNFKILVMRGVTKQIRNEFMNLSYITRVLYRRYVADLNDYMRTRRIMKHVRIEGTIMKPPKTPWHAPGKMLMVNWGSFLWREEFWDWSNERSYKRYFTGCYW